MNANFFAPREFRSRQRASVSAHTGGPSAPPLKFPWRSMAKPTTGLGDPFRALCSPSHTICRFLWSVCILSLGSIYTKNIYWYENWFMWLYLLIFDSMSTRLMQKRLCNNQLPIFLNWTLNFNTSWLAVLFATNVGIQESRQNIIISASAAQHRILKVNLCNFPKLSSSNYDAGSWDSLIKCNHWAIVLQ
jgi:hypothetical protein